jgi:hypothetical protein
MQRLPLSFCQSKKNCSMKTLASFLLISVLFIACKKDTTYPEISGTVISQTGATLNSYLVEIDSLSRQSSYSFFCENSGTMPPIGSYNCRNSIFITNLPASLKVDGMKILFSKYKNLGANPLWSSTYVPRDVEVYDARAK